MEQTVTERNTVTETLMRNGGSPKQTRVVRSVRKTKFVYTKIRQGNEFKERHSHLATIGDWNSNESEFRGFFNLLIILMVFFVFTSQTSSIIYEGSLVGIQAFINTFNRYDLFPAWLGLILAAHVAFILQKMAISGYINQTMHSIAHYTSMTSLFGTCVYICLTAEWLPVQSAFYLTETLILVMKMHSYYLTNAEFQNHTKADQDSSDDETQDADPNSKLLRFPHNITWKNYIDFLLVPALVYELHYPRTQKIRISYLIEKIAAFVGIWAVLHIVVEQYILPVARLTPTMSPLEAYIRLLLPCMVGYLLLFYMIFDVICNGFAEITRFADRQFYSDWWNSTSFDYFARTWNKPVHEWLLRHVYWEGIHKFKMDKGKATLLTFLISSIIHELFMGVTLRTLRPWLFILQMTQLPLIWIGRSKFLRGKRLGNITFWISMMLGPPLLTILYCREFFMLSN